MDPGPRRRRAGRRRRHRDRDATAADVLDALDGHVLWSEQDAATKAWRLVDRSNPLPVATSPAPSDVDLGHDTRGRLVAVYSRCREALREDGANFGRRGCDVFRFDFATARASGCTSATCVPSARALRSRHR